MSSSARDNFRDVFTVHAGDRMSALRKVFDEDVVVYASAPFDSDESIKGLRAFHDVMVEPLCSAIDQVRRRDIIWIEGQNIREYGGKWVSSITHYTGNFNAPFCGLNPSNTLVFFRAGEFFQLNDSGKIIEARLIWDFVDLTIQIGRCPVPQYGNQMVFPAPETMDGILPTNGDAQNSYRIIEAMLDGLHEFDPETFGSENQTGETGTWHKDMLWYGPGGIGSNYRWEGFVKDHREPFLRAFPDRKGGNHYCRISQGKYVALSGWPSMTMTHQGEYFGIPPSGKALTLRVMDFYRCDERQIRENWVCLDYMHLFRQMGLDIIPASNRMVKERVYSSCSSSSEESTC